jgi:OmpR family response regulator RpaB
MEVVAKSQPSSALILVIEDSELVRSMLQTTLARLGYKVVLAVDGYQGLVSIRNQTPDLILCDIEMPGLNGYEVLESLRSTQSKLANWHKIPFVMMSGTSVTTPEPEPEPTEIAPDCYLPKPFNLSELRAVLTKYLPPPAKAS